MPDHQRPAVYLLLALAALNTTAVVAFDLWAWHAYGRDGTLSAALHRLGQHWPLIPFLVGLLVGHLFWS